MELADRITRDARHNLHRALDMGIGKKTLVIAKSVSGIISHFADSAFLKEHGCEKLAYLSTQPIDTADCPTVIYLSRATTAEIDLIAAQVKSILDAAVATDPQSPTGSAMHYSNDKRFYLFCLPRVSLLCRQVLEDRGVLANVEVHDLDIDLVPLEEDLMSLESPCLRDITVAQDDSTLYQLARTVLALETNLGTFSCVRGRGQLAQRFVDMYATVAKSFPPSTMTTASNNTLILFDRTLDLVTPLMTPQTYTSLLDSVRDIQCGFVEVDVPEAPGRTRKFKLSKRDDPVFKELADLHFDVAAHTLKDLAISIRSQNDALQKTESISAINQFVDKLPEIVKSKEMLSIHLRFAEAIRASMDEDYFTYLEAEQGAVSGSEIDIEYINELIWSHRDMYKAMALICLATMTCSIRDKQLESWRSEFLQSYGYQYHSLWTHLESAGLLLRTSSRPRAGAAWPALRRAFDLVHDHVELNNPTHIAYTFTGYAPLSVRIVQELLGVGSILPPSIEMGGGSGPAAATDALQRVLPVPSVEHGSMDPAGHVFVAFLGGVTMAEVSALRLVSKVAKRPVTILTTDMVTAWKVVEAFK